jgi:hypothetical protein
MSTVDEIRRSKLAELAEEYGGASALAAHIGKSAAQISQWLNASPDSKTGRPRGMRGESCRQIEARCNRPSGWMDQSAETSGSSSAGNDFSDEQVFRSKVKLSAGSARLIREIIRAEEQGSSSPKIIEALTKVLHVAIPKATDDDYPKLRADIAKQ